MNVFSFFWDSCPEVQLLGCMVSEVWSYKKLTAILE